MIILASASPRRRELLTQINCKYKVITSNAEEVMEDNLNPEELVAENASRKAMAVAKEYGELPVLGADTVVAMNGHVLGKPVDEADAVRMLSMLQGNTHQVSTGIAFVVNGKVWKTAVTTEVTFAPMSAEEIDGYIATGEPMDKAGAYGIQGRAAAFVKEIKGSYSNVVGLPLHDVCVLAKMAEVDLYGDGKGTSC